MARQFVAGGAALGSLTVLGPPLGLLWWALAPPAQVTVISDGATAPYPISEDLFARDGYYAIMMVLAGLICGYVGYLAQHHYSVRTRTDLRLAVLLGLTAGALLGAVLAWQTGVTLDAALAGPAIAEAEPGDTVEAALLLRARSALVLWAFVAVLQYGLFDAVSLWRGDLPRLSREPHESPSAAGTPAVSPPGRPGTVPE
ncbi:hypothetical protein [Salinactinospora qingdaonensis]|uniref:hypothetical protein n=1 Tax=Salinactinospora qingdaonensis TaxID=702744 RepID=UPI0031EF8E5F